MASDNGGPAFPVNGPNGDHPGMSLLDWFAGQALVAIAHSEFGGDGGGLYADDDVLLGNKTRRQSRIEQLARMSKDTYDLAAAMLAEKRKRDTPTE